MKRSRDPDGGQSFWNKQPVGFSSTFEASSGKIHLFLVCTQGFLQETNYELCFIPFHFNFEIEYVRVVSF